jgi:hypothetical protein
MMLQMRIIALTQWCTYFSENHFYLISLEKTGKTFNDMAHSLLEMSHHALHI